MYESNYNIKIRKLGLIRTTLILSVLSISNLAYSADAIGLGERIKELTKQLNSDGGVLKGATIYQSGREYTFPDVVIKDGMYYLCNRSQQCSDGNKPPGSGLAHPMDWVGLGPASSADAIGLGERVNELTKQLNSGGGVLKGATIYQSGREYTFPDVVIKDGMYYLCNRSIQCSDGNKPPGSGLAHPMDWVGLGPAVKAKILENPNKISPIVKEAQFSFGTPWGSNTISSVKYVFDEDLDTLVISYPPGSIAGITSPWGADYTIVKNSDADIVTLTKKADISYQVTQIGFNLELEPGNEFKSLTSTSSQLNGKPIQIANKGIITTDISNSNVGFDPFPKTDNDQILTRYSGYHVTHKTFKRPTYLDEDGNEHEYMIGGYFTDWGIYPNTGYTPNQIPVNNINFLQVSFAAICGEGGASNWFGNESATEEAKPKIVERCQGKPTGTMIIPDHFAHYGKADMNLPEWKREWNKGAYHVIGYQRDYKFFLSRFEEKEYHNLGGKRLTEQDGYSYAWGLKNDFSHMERVLNRHKQGIRMYLSIGGWTLSDPFPVIAANPTYRTNFIDSVINYLKVNEHITGIDLDWEFIGVDGAKAGAMSDADTDNYTKLIYELRQRLDLINPDYHLTAAVGTAPKHLNKINWTSKVIDGRRYPGVSDMLDNIFLMSYDYYGAWDTKVGHQTALYTNGAIEGYSIDSAVQYLKNIGVNSRKIVIGYAGYGRLWANVVESEDNQNPDYIFPNQSIGQHPGEIGTSEAANVAWRHIKRTAYDITGKLKANYAFVRDDKAKAEFLVATNPDESSKNVVVTLDTPWTVEQKAKYVKSQKLGGMFTWSLDNDNGDLLNAAHTGFGSKMLYGSQRPSPRRTSLLLYRSKEAEYCSNDNTLAEYTFRKIQFYVMDLWSLGTLSMVDTFSTYHKIITRAIAQDKNVHDLTDAEWQDYFDAIRKFKDINGNPIHLDSANLNKTHVLELIRSRGKIDAFNKVSDLFKPPLLIGLGLTATNDVIWDKIVPAHSDYCGQITRDSLDPFQQIGKDFPELKENFNY
ncbi:glycoside hydrolase family 18 protein [Vibrio europaeus]|uniref:chitinase n=6 Tax=Vibrio europaeus TaxID=300876 RepID=A0A178J3R6_9VIBR|nr:glycosyl hydrolase family 18 protein [Vibrio europaeus]MDC5743395.1 glycosyl hydrolase family 18 protein [Vibrio europaeus]OAM96703.1 hypothetical protein AZ468_23710 [Vibrio europaeus]